ncbi:hypothetical protein BY996DRAFT_6585545, partial [Phakopsora pachyrhizi]
MTYQTVSLKRYRGRNGGRKGKEEKWAESLGGESMGCESFCKGEEGKTAREKQNTTNFRG